MAWLLSKALVDSFANSHSSRAPEADCSPRTSSAGAQSARSKTTNMPQAYWSPARMTEPSRRSRSGQMTFGDLTESHGEEVLTWFLGVSRVLTSPLLEKAQVLTESTQDSGKKCLGSFAKFDQASSSLRTAQRSLLGEDHESCLILPRWGSMWSGECWERTPVAHGTNENASGLLPTVVASSGGRTLPPGTTRTGRAPDGTKKTVSLEQALKMTPQRLGRQMVPTLTVHGNYNRKGASAKWRRTRHCSEPGGAADAVRPRLPIAGEEVVCGAWGGQKGEQLPFVAGGPLNGDWCEWHMGVPRGWTKLEPMAPENFKRWLDGEGSADWDCEWPDVPRTGGDARNRVQRITALGNAQVPACAALAWLTLTERAFGAQ